VESLAGLDGFASSAGEFGSFILSLHRFEFGHCGERRELREKAAHPWDFVEDQPRAMYSWRMETRMETRTVTTIEGISIEVARVLLDQAAAAGVSPDEYLKSLLGLANGQPRDVAPSLAEFDAAMEEFAEDVQPLPSDFSREDIYFPE
jgi:hypothetical protein